MGCAHIRPNASSVLREGGRVNAIEDAFPEGWILSLWKQPPRDPVRANGPAACDVPQDRSQRSGSALVRGKVA
jgi:hypothetical protein